MASPSSKASSDQAKSKPAPKPDQKSGSGDKSGQKPPFNLGQFIRDHLLIVGIVVGVVIVAIIAAVIWWLNARQYESTDDATLDASVVTVEAPVTGVITALPGDGTDVAPNGGFVTIADPLKKQPDVQLPAPAAGKVANLRVSKGSSVQPGQQLLSIVPSDYWVTANFKETQLADMRTGQVATIHLDAYPDRTFTGHVAGFQAGAGSAFTLLPPENATGNFVKTVQRVPVRISFDLPLTADPVLGPGLSASVDVKVR